MYSSTVLERGSRMACVLILATLVVGFGSVSSARGARGSFVVTCDYSHSLEDDPIIWPDQPGASHLHDFFGNEGTNANSSLLSMRRDDTKCRLLSDRAGYWSPAVYLDRVQVTPDRVRAYYFGIARDGIDSYPRGLQMVAGNASATTAEENPHVKWFCGAAKKLATGTPVSTHPYDCTRYARTNPFVDGLVAKVDFPNCWNGIGLERSDVTYALHGFVEPGEPCPEGFEHALPRLILRIHFGFMDPCLGAKPCRWDRAPEENIKLSLSSGGYVTYHADFWNAWQQRRLDHFIQVCLVEHTPCGGLVSGRL